MFSPASPDFTVKASPALSTTHPPSATVSPTPARAKLYRRRVHYLAGGIVDYHSDHFDVGKVKDAVRQLELPGKHIFLPGLDRRRQGLGYSIVVVVNDTSHVVELHIIPYYIRARLEASYSLIASAEDIVLEIALLPAYGLPSRQRQGGSRHSLN